MRPDYKDNDEQPIVDNHQYIQDLIKETPKVDPYDMSSFVPSDSAEYIENPKDLSQSWSDNMNMARLSKERQGRLNIIYKEEQDGYDDIPTPYASIDEILRDFEEIRNALLVSKDNPEWSVVNDTWRSIPDDIMNTVSSIPFLRISPEEHDKYSMVLRERAKYLEYREEIDRHTDVSLRGPGYESDPINRFNIKEYDNNWGIDSSWIDNLIDNAIANTDEITAEYLEMLRPVASPDGSRLWPALDDPEIQLAFQLLQEIEGISPDLDIFQDPLSHGFNPRDEEIAKYSEDIDQRDMAYKLRKEGDSAEIFHSNVQNLIDAFHGEDDKEYRMDVVEELILKYHWQPQDFISQGMVITDDLQPVFDRAKAKGLSEFEIKLLQGDPEALVDFTQDFGIDFTQASGIDPTEEMGDVILSTVLSDENQAILKDPVLSEINQISGKNLSNKQIMKNMFAKYPNILLATTPKQMQDLHNKIQSLTLKRERLRANATIDNIPLHIKNEVLVEQFNEKYGTDYKGWSGLMDAMALNSLSNNQFLWVMEVHTEDKRLSAGVTSTPSTALAKVIKNTSSAQNGKSWDANHRLEFLLLTGSADPDVYDAYTAGDDRLAGMDTRIRKGWTDRIITRKKQIAARGLDPALVDEAMLPFDTMIQFMAEGGDLFNPQYSEWAEYVGSEYGRILLGSAPTSSSAEIKVLIDRSLKAIESGDAMVGAESVGAYKFLIGIKNAGEKKGVSNTVVETIVGTGRSKWGALIISQTIDTLLAESGGDITALDPNDFNKTLKLVRDKHEQLFYAAAQAAQETPSTISSYIPTDIADFLKEVGPHNLFAISDTALESLWGVGYSSNDREKRNEILASQYDEFLRTLNKLAVIPGTTSELDDPTHVQGQIWRAMAPHFGQFFSRLDKDVTTEMTDQQRILFALRAALGTEQSRHAFRGAIASAAYNRNNITTPPTLDSIFNFYASFMEAGRTAIIPMGFDNTGLPQPVHVAVTPNFSYMNWATPPAEKYSSATAAARYNFDLWDQSITYSDKETKKSAYRTLTRNFSKLAGINPGENITANLLRPALDSAWNKMLEINASVGRSNKRAGLMDMHFLVAEELTKGQHKLPFSVPQLQDFVNEGLGAKGKTVFEIVVGNQRPSGNTLGISRDPFVRLSKIEKVVDIPATWYRAGTDKDVVKRAIDIPWISLHDEDYILRSSTELVEEEKAKAKEIIQQRMDSLSERMHYRSYWN